MPSKLELAGSLSCDSDERVWHVSWTPNGAFIASCGEDKIVRIWTSSSVDESGKVGLWEPSSSMRCISTLEDAQSKCIRCCEWSPDATMLACASFDCTVVIWEAQNPGRTKWDQITCLEGHDSEVKSVAWSKNGRWLASCGRDKKVWIWEKLDGNEFECVSMLDGHTQDVKFVKWHPRRSVLYSASYDDSLKVWTKAGMSVSDQEDEEDDADDDDEFYCNDTLTKHSSTVWGIAIDPSGRRLVSSSDDLSLTLWESENGASGLGKWRPTCSIPNLHAFPIYSVDWSRNHEFIATGGGDNAITLTSVGSSSEGGLLQQEWRGENMHAGDVNCVRWNPNPAFAHVLASCGDEGLIKIWHLKIE